MIKKLLLALLNFLDKTPSFYASIDNVNNYSRQFLDFTAERQPEITLKKFLEDMTHMDKCMQSGEGCVILGGVAYKGDDVLLQEISKNV